MQSRIAESVNPLWRFASLNAIAWLVGSDGTPRLGQIRMNKPLEEAAVDFRDGFSRVARLATVSSWPRASARSICSYARLYATRTVAPSRELPLRHADTHTRAHNSNKRSELCQPD